MAMWPGGSLKLIQPMSMVLVPMLPEVRLETGTLEYDTGDVHDFPQSTWIEFLTITDERDAISDVIISIEIIDNLADNSDLVFVYLNSNPMGPFFTPDGLDCGGGRQYATHVMTADEFNEMRTIGWGYPDPRRIDGVFALWSNGGGSCPTKLYRIQVSYDAVPLEQTAGYAYLQPWTNHLTQVAGPNERQGVPHYHAGQLRVDARTGKFVVVNESLDGKLTLGGFQATPADADGNQINTRPPPGSLECLTTGEVGGVVAKFHGDGEGEPV